MSGLVDGAMKAVTPDRLKRAAAVIGTVLIAAILFGVVVFGLTRLWPRKDETPTIVARKDEKTAARAATAIGVETQTRTQDATVHIDLTTKEIRNAFDALPAPLPQPGTGAEPRPLPTAPVDGVRDRLNEGIARANRAAGSAGAPD